MASTPMTSEVWPPCRMRRQQVATVRVGAEQVTRRLNGGSERSREDADDRVGQRQHPSERDREDDDGRADGADPDLDRAVAGPARSGRAAQLHLRDGRVAAEDRAGVWLRSGGVDGHRGPPLRVGPAGPSAGRAGRRASWTTSASRTVTRTVAWMSGKSRCSSALTTSSPTPGHLKTTSTMTTPLSIAAKRVPSAVTTGIAELANAYRQVSARSETPRERATVTYGAARLTDHLAPHEPGDERDLEDRDGDGRQDDRGDRGEAGRAGTSAGCTAKRMSRTKPIQKSGIDWPAMVAMLAPSSPAVLARRAIHTPSGMATTAVTTIAATARVIV